MEERETRDYVFAICFDGSRVIYGDDSSVIVMETSTMKEVDRIEMGAFIYDVNVLNVSGENFLIVGCDDNTGRVVDLKTKSATMTTLSGHDGYVYAIIGCEDMDVLTGSQDHTIRRWNRLTGECIRTFTGNTQSVYSVVYDKETKRVFSGSGDKTIMMWNAETGDMIGVLTGHSGSVLSIALVNATTIVSGCDDKTIRIWNTMTMTEIKIFSAHTGYIDSVAITPDGQCVISGSADKTVKLWSIETGECTTLFCHESCVNKVTVSPDGRYIASGGDDKIFRLLAVTSPFPFIVHQGLLTRSNETASNHRLLSDGTVLHSSERIAASITRAVICTLNTGSQFSIKNDNPSEDINYSAPSGLSALLWVEAICAVKENLRISIDKRSFSSKNIILRYRFNIIQFINFHHKRIEPLLFLPKDVVKIIGNYVI